MKATICILVLGVVLSRQAVASENPDELYKQGRFAEAEKAYADADMDHPKDLRYRYNRGCAAYQNSDYQGALAAFSSVSRRAQDNEARFMAAYNLGNTAFKQGDFQSAAAHYKQAIVYNPESEDAKYNLELTLKELQKLKQEQHDGPETESQEDSEQTEGQGDQCKTDRQGEDSGESSQEKASDQESSQAQDQKGENGQTESGKEGESEQEHGTRQDQGRQAEEDAPKDLSGELKPMRGLSEEEEDDQASGATMSMIDRRKAESLLDNVKENRTRFLQFQVPEEKKRGVSSGRDW